MCLWAADRSVGQNKEWREGRRTPCRASRTRHEMHQWQWACPDLLKEQCQWDRLRMPCPRSINSSSADRERRIQAKLETNLRLAETEQIGWLLNFPAGYLLCKFVYLVQRKTNPASHRLKLHLTFAPKCGCLLVLHRAESTASWGKLILMKINRENKTKQHRRRQCWGNEVTGAHVAMAKGSSESWAPRLRASSSHEGFIF